MSGRETQTGQSESLYSIFFRTNINYCFHIFFLETQQIAAERIHVERAINKIKNFHLFDQVIPLSLAGSINQLWTVCGLLTLFQKPIIS